MMPAMQARFLDDAAETPGPRRVRYTRPGWYVLADDGQITEGPFESRTEAEQVIAAQYPPAPR